MKRTVTITMEIDPEIHDESDTDIAAMELVIGILEILDGVEICSTCKVQCGNEMYEYTDLKDEDSKDD
jgi:hypothetical protein